MPEQNPDQPRNVRSSIKGPLMFSLVLGVVAFFAVLFFASGGTGHGMRFDLAFTGAGIAFIVSLVFSAMMSLTHRDNAEYIGSGRLPEEIEAEARARAAAETPASSAEESEPRNNEHTPDEGEDASGTGKRDETGH